MSDQAVRDIGGAYLPTWIAHADWGSAPSKRVVASAERREDIYLMHSPRAVGTGELLTALHVTARDGEPTLLGFDFPIGVPHAYARLAGIESFASWFRQLDPCSSFFEVAVDLRDISAARPFFPKHLATKSPGIKAAFHAALGLPAIALLRRCDVAHCGRRAASEIFWTLGPQAVGKATLSGWSEVLRPALDDAGRRYAIWPFDGRLQDLLGRRDAVIVETYPADAYRQLSLRMGSRGTRKTSHADRLADATRLLERCERDGIVPEPELIQQIQAGFGTGRAGEDAFDAVVGLLAMISTLRHRSEPHLPDEQAVLRYEGWMFGRHATCPA
jgi:hypothetical protein